MIISPTAPKHLRLQVVDMNDTMYCVLCQTSDLLGTVTKYDTDVTAACEPMLKRLYSINQEYCEEENPHVAMRMARESIELMRAIHVMEKGSCVMVSHLRFLSTSLEKDLDRVARSHMDWIGLTPKN